MPNCLIEIDRLLQVLRVGRGEIQTDRPEIQAEKQAEERKTDRQKDR